MAAINTGNIIASAQTITDAWADMGSEIQTGGYSFFTSFIQLDINDSVNVQFRYIYLNVSGGLEYPSQIKIAKQNKILVKPIVYEIDDDIDQNIPLQTGLDQNIEYIKLQVKALTVGATAGIITTAVYRQGYRQ